MRTVTHFNKWLALLLLTFSAAFVHGKAQAQEAPDAMVKRVSQEIIETIKSDKDLRAGDPHRVQEVVESKLVPYIDFKKTTALAVGRNWRTATPEQQQQLITEFRNLLIYTYSGALRQFREQKVVFKPFRADPADTDVVVNSQVVMPGREPAQLSYRLEKAPDGWKIYDVNVLGAWLTESYKNTFVAEVNKGGIEGLIRTLTEKNQQLARNAEQRLQKKAD